MFTLNEILKMTFEKFTARVFARCATVIRLFGLVYEIYNTVNIIAYTFRSNNDRHKKSRCCSTFATQFECVFIGNLLANIE